MAAKLRRLAKTSAPRLSGVVPRKRLFNLVDDARERPLLWISGPPGAGKTTLLASYLHSKKLAHTWYQFDQGDADPATWFHYLQRSVEPVVERQQVHSRLPTLTPEYLPDLAGFSRRWLRSCFELLPAPLMMVFDNYQDVPDDAPIHALLRAAIEDLPQDMNVVVISRGDPPAEYSRLQANRLVTVIDWEDLQLTLEETSKIAALDLSLSDETTREVHAETQGWAAGVTLMLERLRRTGQVNRIDRGDSMETVFNYFAELLFKHASASDQRVLLELAHLPTMTLADVEAITGNAGAVQLLESMFRRRLFVDRRAGPPFQYAFHALFRAFLLNRCEQIWDSETRRRVRQSAGKALATAGHIEQACALYRNAQDWQGVAGLVVTQAPALIKEGRWQTLLTWITSLPPSAYESSGWLPYWHGVSLLAADPKGSQILFETAHGQFLQAEDPLGQALAASGFANGLFFEYVSFAPAGKWIAVLEQLLANHPQWPSHEIEFHVLSSFLILLVYHHPRHPLLEPCVTRLQSLFAEPFDAGAKVGTAAFMLHASSWWGNHTVAQRIVNVIQPMSLTAAVAPLYQSWWKIALCCNGILLGNTALALTAGPQGHEVVDANGLVVVKDKLNLYRLYAFLAAGDVAQAQSLCTELAHIPSSGSPIEIAMYLWERSWLSLLHGDAQASLRDIERAQEFSGALGVPNFEVHLLLGKAIALNRLSRQHEALRCIARIRNEIAGTQSPLFDFSLLCVESESAFGAGDQVHGRALLAQAFEIGRAHNQISSAQWISAMMSSLCAHALRLGIEPQYTMELIKKRSLTAPSRNCEEWPWLIKIFTLGRFELWRDAVPYQAERKTPRQALALLKLLAGAGAHGMRVESLVQALWDDLDGDGAQNALKAAIHRLRKLLGADETIISRDQSLSLNPELCWTDAATFEEFADKIIADDSSVGLSCIEAHGQQLLRLYRGHFLPEDAEWSGLAVTRDRLRAKFHRTVLSLGKTLEDGAAKTTALQLYLRALDLDNLAEDIYRRVIDLYIRAGDSVSALNTYRRCRQILSIVLGIRPSLDIEAMVRLIR